MLIRFDILRITIKRYYFWNRCNIYFEILSVEMTLRISYLINRLPNFNVAKYLLGMIILTI